MTRSQRTFGVLTAVAGTLVVGVTLALSTLTSPAGGSSTRTAGADSPADPVTRGAAPTRTITETAQLTVAAGVVRVTERPEAVTVTADPPVPFADPGVVTATLTRQQVETAVQTETETRTEAVTEVRVDEVRVTVTEPAPAPTTVTLRADGPTATATVVETVVDRVVETVVDSVVETVVETVEAPAPPPVTVTETVIADAPAQDPAR